MRKEYRPYLSIEEVAAMCGCAPDTIRILIDLRANIYLTNHRGWRKITIEFARWFAKHYPDPNMALPDSVKGPLFARHDDGRWWPILSQEEAVVKRKARYFEGTACESGHIVKRYTKTGKCVDCCHVMNGKLTSKEKCIAKSFAASPGCNLPQHPTY
jgi:hypothetical protein